MNFYEMLEHLESLSGSNDKEDYLVYILNHVKNAEMFFRFTFNEQVFGVKEQTFKNAFGNPKFSEHNHISEFLATTEFEPMKDGKAYKIPDLINFGFKLMHSSGQELETKLSNFIRQCKPLQKKWFTRAILKDLRCGVQIKTMNKVFKRLSLEEIKKFSLQLCGKIDLLDKADVQKKMQFPCVMECKYDGIRLQAEVYTDGEETRCVLTSRRGKDKTEAYSEITEALAEQFAGENIILDGEIISASFQELTRKDSKANKKFVIFDNITDETLKYQDRWDNLMTLCSSRGVNCITDLKENKINNYNNKHICTAEHYDCNNIDEAQQFYHELNIRGEEGIIIKLSDKKYVRGSRKYMFKCKKVYTADLLCIGYKLGTGKRSGMVSTLCLEDKSKTIKVDVGSGIDDDTCEQLTGDLEREFVGKIVEIKYNEITSTGSIRFPRFITIREDKDEADDLSSMEVRQDV